MNRRTIVGICLFSFFLMATMPLIPTVQSIEIEKEVKSVIEERIEQIRDNFNPKIVTFDTNWFLRLYYLFCRIVCTCMMYFILDSFMYYPPYKSGILICASLLSYFLAIPLMIVYYPIQFLMASILLPIIFIDCILHPFRTISLLENPRDFYRHYLWAFQFLPILVYTFLSLYFFLKELPKIINNVIDEIKNLFTPLYLANIS